MGRLIADQLKAHPLTGTSLAHHDVLYALTHLQRKEDAHRCRNDRLREIAVLLVLYVEEVIENRQSQVLGIARRTLWNILQERMRLHCASCNIKLVDLVIAVAEVDTASTTTRLLESCDLGPLPLDELPSSSTLVELHCRLMRTSDITDESAPHASWLAHMFSSGLMLSAMPLTLILHSRADGQRFLRVTGVVACCFALWSVRNRHSRASWPHSRTLVHGTIWATLLLIALDMARPAAEVDFEARERFARHPQVMSVMYSFLGALLSDQVTMRHSGASDALVAILFACVLVCRAAQLVLVSLEPAIIFWTCVRCQALPFAAGFVALQLFAMITLRLWRELRQARSQTDAANVEVAQVRSHAWAVEAARREQLTSAASPRTGVSAGGHLPYLAEGREQSIVLELLRRMRHKQKGDMANAGFGRRLVRRFIYVRELVFVVPTLALIAARNSNFAAALGLDRAHFASITICVAMSSLASIFPAELTSTAARQYLNSLVLSMAAVSTIVSMRYCYSSLSAAAAAAEGSTALTAVHVSACVGHILASSTSVTSHLRGNYSWAHVRAFLLVDGLLLGATVVALHILGHDSAAPVFPPGGVRFSSACLRSGCTIGWGLALTRGTRQHLHYLFEIVGIEPPSVMITRALSSLTSGGAVSESSMRAQPLFAPSGLAPSVRQVMRSQLAARFGYSRLLCISLAGIWWVVKSVHRRTPQAWLPERLWLWTFGVLLAGILILVSVFPSEFDSREGRAFFLPVAAVVQVIALSETYTGFFVSGTVTHVNLACKLAHAFLCLAINASWTALLAKVASCQGSWRAVRCVLFADGLSCGVCACAMRLLGPTPAYLPGNVTFMEALERATTTPILALLLSPANRDRISAVANSLGLKHVTVTLDEIESEMTATAGIASETQPVVRPDTQPQMPSQVAQQPQPPFARKGLPEALGHCAASLEQDALSSHRSSKSDVPQPSRLNPLIRQTAASAARPSASASATSAAPAVQPSAVRRTAEHDVAMAATAVSDELALAYVAAHPLSGNALSTEDVEWLSWQLQLRERHGYRLWPGDDPLRLAAVLLVLFAEECLMHRRPSALGLTADECYGLLQDVVQSCAISHNDLMEAVALVDTEGSATHLVHSHAISAVGLWDSTGNGIRDPIGHGAATGAAMDADTGAGGADTGTGPGAGIAATSATDSAADREGTPSLAMRYRLQAGHLSLAVVVAAAGARSLADDHTHYNIAFCYIVLSGFTLVTLAGRVSSHISRRARLALLRRISPPSSSPVMLFAIYMAVLMIYSYTLPPHVLAARTRSHLTHYWQHYVISYAAMGCFTSLQPTSTSMQRVRNLSVLLLLALRGLQVSAADSQPIEVLQLGLKAAALPFVLGFLLMRQQELLVRMWLEIGAARREARSSSARVAAERQHAQSLEMARRVMLVARKSSRASKGRRGTTHRERMLARSNPSDSSWLVGDVVQEEGYQSPS